MEKKRMDGIELIKIADLGKDVDYRLVAQMIYNIDPCLYKDFFGSEENAVSYIKEALNMDFSIFNKEYLNVLVDKDANILGTAVVFPKDAKYYEEAERSFFEWNGLEISPAFDYVSEYYKNFINNNEGVLKISSINVDANKRGYGYGSQIMKEIDRITKGKTKYLTVLGENGRAIRTYWNNGYVPVKDFDDYYGVHPKGVELASCISMVKSDNLHTKPLDVSLEELMSNPRQNTVVSAKDYFDNFSKNPKKFVVRGDYNPELQAKASEREERE